MRDCQTCPPMCRGPCHNPFAVPYIRPSWKRLRALVFYIQPPTTSPEGALKGPVAARQEWFFGRKAGEKSEREERRWERLWRNEGTAATMMSALPGLIQQLLYWQCRLATLCITGSFDTSKLCHKCYRWHIFGFILDNIHMLTYAETVQHIRQYTAWDDECSTIFNRYTVK